MTRRKLIGAAIFGAAGLGIARLAGAAGYVVDDDDEGREGNERNEKEQAPAPNSTPTQQPQNGATAALFNIATAVLQD